MLLSLDASNDCETVVVVASDTDVLILCLAYAHKFPSLLLKSGTSKLEIINIKAVASSLGPEVCDALIGMHAYTGCDTVSCFSGRGKISALKMLKKDKDICNTMQLLGEDWTVNQDLFSKFNRFTCISYSAHTNCASVNELRYELFRLKKGKVHSAQLPPCKDTLFQHAAITRQLDEKEAIFHAHQSLSLWVTGGKLTTGLYIPSG